MVPPRLALAGGYQSPDIILTDRTTQTPGPIGGMPGGVWDTLLRPDTDYDLAVNLNVTAGIPSEMYWVDVTVRFWSFDGGLGTVGVPLDTQVVTNQLALGLTVPFTVNCSVPFRSAPAGQHRCAAVSFANVSLTDLTRGTVTQTNQSCPDATDATMVPDPGNGCSAWRNTDSQLVHMRKRWGMGIGFGARNAPVVPEPVRLVLHTHYVPRAWHDSARVRDTLALMRGAGGGSRVPAYLLPGLRETLQPVHLCL